MKKYQIINIAFAAIIVIGDLFYTIFGGLWLKGLTSFGFVAMGAVNLVAAFKTEYRKFAIIMLIGLVFAMLGDIVLNIEFMYGAILFAIGHVFYFVAYMKLSKFKWTELLYAACIFVPCALIILFLPIFNYGSDMLKYLCVVYALVISLMTGRAISNYVQNKSTPALIIIIGSALFCFSDLMLLFDAFANVSAIFEILCLATYYPAQILLAYSIFSYSKNKKQS